jgi:hypothetical protein
MTFDHRVVHAAPFRFDAVANAILTEGAAAIEAKGGRLFGLFNAEIGLSRNHAVVLTEWPDAAAAAHGRLIVPAALGDDAKVEYADLWEPTLRPNPGARVPEKPGIISHRRFDIRSSDLDTFLELSGGAWDNFENVHDSEVIGLWKSRMEPAAGQTRMWLMAWYKDLATWEGARYYLESAKPAAKEANDRLRKRYALTLESGVSLTRRIDRSNARPI